MLMYIGIHDPLFMSDKKGGFVYIIYYIYLIKFNIIKKKKKKKKKKTHFSTLIQKGKKISYTMIR
jgi:preprotein translocase subunit YajC